jgi:hypothetical protein
MQKVVLVIVVLLLLALGLVTCGETRGGVQSITITPAGPTTQAIGGSPVTYEVTVTLDQPAQLNLLGQAEYAFTGNVPTRVESIDFVEADDWWDDVLYSKTIEIPLGATSGTTTFDITCEPNKDTAVRGDELSDEESEHQLRAEVGVLQRESDIVVHRCVAELPPPVDPPPPLPEDPNPPVPDECPPTACSFMDTSDVVIPGQCPTPCSWVNSDREPWLTLSARAQRLEDDLILRSSGAAEACAGPNCRCAPAGSSRSISNCQTTSEGCQVRLTVTVQGTCNRG